MMHNSQLSVHVPLHSVRLVSRRLVSRRLVSRQGGGQAGYTLISVLLIIMIIGIMGIGSMSLSHVSEKSAGNAIQRSRAFQAADGGAAIGENELQSRLQRRIFADSAATDGVFKAGTYTPKWWRTENYEGSVEVDPDAILGVIKAPRYIIEEVGQYVNDGGSGVANLDLGSGSYGGGSRGGRNVVLYRVESHGTGSFNEVQSVIETVVGISY